MWLILSKATLMIKYNLQIGKHAHANMFVYRINKSVRPDFVAFDDDDKERAGGELFRGQPSSHSMNFFPFSSRSTPVSFGEMKCE